MISDPARAYADAEEYETLCRLFKVSPQFSQFMAPWPYNIDEKHYYELKNRFQKEKN